MFEQMQFTATSEAEAKKIADAWWAKQIGLTRIEEYVGPTGKHLAGKTGHQWVATLIYEKKSRP